MEPVEKFLVSDTPEMRVRKLNHNFNRLSRTREVKPSAQAPGVYTELREQIQAQIDVSIAAMYDTYYPVGRVILTYTEADPVIAMRGTWRLDCAGKFVRGALSGQAGRTGGDNVIHQENLPLTDVDAESPVTSPARVKMTGAEGVPFLPEYQTVYMYRRVE